MGTTHTVDGVVRHGNGDPATGVELLLVDVDAGIDDALGHATTRGDGRFEIRFSEADYGPENYDDLELRAHAFDDGRKLDEWPIPTDESAELTLPAADDDGLSMMEMMEDRHHGMGEQRGMSNVPRDPSHPGRGRFGRMFPYLAAADHDLEFLRELGLPGGPLDEDAGSDPVGESNTPAGFVFLGQFIDHDITLDPLSSLSRRNDPDAIRNFRTARLDLDSVYGAGPEADPFRYQSPMAGGDDGKLLLGEGEHHLPRNHEDVALIADPRNDENLILSELQYAMLRFHNAIYDTETVGFDRAQQLARWHYQWIVLHEYLPTVCDDDVVSEVLAEGRNHYTVGPETEAFMPLEFAGAAFRFGHSQARLRYRIDSDTEGRLFGPPGDDDALGPGFRPVSRDQYVDWRHLFDLDDPSVDFQNAREIDPQLASDLLDLPFVTSDAAWRRSLPSRNLVRGRQLGLPSGQSVARAIEGAPVLSNDDVGFDDVLDRFGQPPDTEMPLWYYVLAEAREQTGGEHLGVVGSHIVAEVLVGLVAADTSSFLTVQPGWTPTLPGPHSGAGEFTMADLLEYALGGAD